MSRRQMPGTRVCPPGAAGWSSVVALVLAWLPGLARAQPAVPAPAASAPVPAIDSLALFQLPPGLKIELVASEPEVVDPVEIRFDARGRMWVVEMRDYPHGPVPGQPAASRVTVLEDRDHDGRYETAHRYAEHLPFATGLQLWQGGALVTLAGQVAFLPDADGDLRADRVETWYQGFALENPQLRANHPRLALDNFVYVANGLRGGTVVDARQSTATPVSISGRDFRFDPLRGDYEAISGVGQFGLTFDDDGQRFICSNRNPLMHVVIEDRYLRGNPHVAVPSTFADVAQPAERSRLYPVSRAWTTSNLHAGQFTAACGCTIFRGTALPAEYRGQAFTCDPTGNLVHCEVLADDGVTFTAQPKFEGREFLASPDEWFRPVNLEVGPDGALYVVDMYRAVIEHPDFMPEELQRRRDLRDGDDRGRIYRIVADQQPRPADHPADLTALDDEQLVRLLAHDNAWQSDTASQLLVQRESSAVSEALRRCFASSRHSPARFRALWTLEGRNELTTDDVRLALTDGDPRVCRQGLLLLEKRFASVSELRNPLVSLARHEHLRVRFQAVLTAAALQQPLPVETLAATLCQSPDDPWMLQAVRLAAGDQAAALASRLWVMTLDEMTLPDAVVGPLLSEFAQLAAAAPNAAGARELLGEVLAAPPSDRVVARQLTVLVALAEQRQRHGNTLTDMLHSDDDAARRDDRMRRLVELQQQAQQLARNASDESLRQQALRLAAYDPGAVDWLRDVALRGEPLSDRLLAIDLLAQHPTSTPWTALLAQFADESPTVRQRILAAVLQRPERTGLLLAAIEQGQIAATDLDRNAVDRLTQYPQQDLRTRSRQLLAAAVPADRQQVLAAYAPALQLPADAQQGREVFARNCATCHRIGDLGVEVAPDISDSRTKTPEQLMGDILQPNRAVDGNFIGYSVQLRDGRLLSGILRQESANAITLQQPEGRLTSILRPEIEQLRSSGLSLMPEGLEKNISLQAMADLLAFIKQWRYLDGAIPLDLPRK